ncbi:hypothetical protein [Winogradskyella aurantiaca]|uniref:hypothetical protein n=1 Tax=Winogradskyella aurantiaca TaxID=2219558 RepID=UPI000E1D3103|nr:hypothetical protein [Winogradskyella aurantiaca]
MKLLLALVIVPVICFSQTEDISFAKLDTPTMFVGKTKNGIKLQYRLDGNIKYYRMTFPVYESDPAQGEGYMDFEANDAQIEGLRVHMVKSITSVFDKTDYEIGTYVMEMYTNKTEKYGKEKTLGKTSVTILRPDDGQPTEKLKYNGKIQEGYFTITETEVNRLFGRLQF